MLHGVCCTILVILTLNFQIEHSIQQKVPFERIVNFLQTNRDDVLDRESAIDSYRSAQDEIAGELKLEAIRKARAADKIRQFAKDVGAAKARKGKEREEFEIQLNVNLAQAKLLDKESQLLSDRASEMENQLKDFLASPDKASMHIHNCNIFKVGPLNLATRVDDVKESLKSGLVGKLTGQELTLYLDKMPFVTYILYDIVLPVKSVEGAPTCFSFKYRGTHASGASSDRVLCASTRSSAHSWMNAISEAWFCANKGIQGTLVGRGTSNSEIENDKKRLDAFRKSVPKGLVNVNVSLDKDHKIHVLVNGKEKPSESVIDVGKLIGEMHVK
ncbi:conserved Plasmodium protein, unknown function [Babesia microti strain RI]|uniref:PH domain-containing protein n=1 Tax=Babesia microti (strain RI) TaxID=1133968 RepID=A0A1R4AAN7_BABMR|nr:conserved Plasmodium protein, unknown function [Babesia microti strain RI]SJK86069.1 conserved Plasmodium protein, unknown function [Babesia microti strain RI]|eukprot:XP_021338265.1 conserved Plasmodium protein, unknown function [Babesia microti strain RI]